MRSEVYADTDHMTSQPRVFNRFRYSTTGQ